MRTEPLVLIGELFVTEDGSIVVGREELATSLDEWCHGRADHVRVTIEEIENE